MANHSSPPNDPDQPVTYQIRIKGHLSQHWADWFEGLSITLEDNGETVLTGSLADQAALHGVLKKVRDLGMPLLSVNGLKSDQPVIPDVKNITITESKRPGGSE